MGINSLFSLWSQKTGNIVPPLKKLRWYDLPIITLMHQSRMWSQSVSKAHAFEHITQLHKDALFAYLTQDHPGETEVNVIKEKKLKSLNALPATAFPRPQGQTLSFSGSSGAMQGQGRCGPLSSQLLTCYYLSSGASSNLFPESNFLLQHLIAPLWMNPISSIYSFYLKTMCLGTGK